MANKQIFLTGVALLTTMASSEAAAQSMQRSLDQSQKATPGNFARDRNVSVAERQRFQYSALGIREGGFVFWPQVTVNAEYNDNIFATPNDKVADGVTRIAPELDLSSNWSNHLFQAYARGGFNQYWENSNQNTNDFSVGANGRVDVRRSAQVNAGVDFSRATEPRTEAATAGNEFPIQYDLTSVYLAGAKEFNRLRLSSRLDWKHYDFLDRTGNFPQGDRDRNESIWAVRADYAVSPDTAVFLEVTGNNRNYRLSQSPIIDGVPEFPGFINRDSNGLQVLAGANFELGALLRGEIGVGYLKQNFKDSAFRDVSGPGARVQVEWFPSQLTTVTLSGTRTVEDAAITGASAYLANSAALKVDHELLRNLILSASAEYGKDDYRDISRQDERYLAGIGGTYLLNRNVGLTIAYSYYKQNSSGTDVSVASGNFTVNKVAITLTLQL